MDPHFVIMARTDALATEGMDGALRRIEVYANAGADMIFPGFSELYQHVCACVCWWEKQPCQQAAV